MHSFSSLARLIHLPFVHQIVILHAAKLKELNLLARINTTVYTLSAPVLSAICPLAMYAIV